LIFPGKFALLPTLGRLLHLNHFWAWAMYHFIRNLPRRWKRLILLSADILLAPLCLWIAIALQVETLWPEAMLAANWQLLVVTAALAGGLSSGLGIHRIKLNAYETRAVLKTGLLALLLMLAAAGFGGASGSGLSLAGFIIFGFLYFSLSVAAHLIGLQILLWIYRQGQNRTRVLIYGAGATGVQLAAALTRSEEIEPVGFVDDNQTLQGSMVAGLKVHAPGRIPELVKRLAIDRVVLAMPSLSLPRQTQMARRLERIGCDVHRLPSFSELIGNRDLVNTLEPVRPTDFLGRSRLDTELPGVSGNYAGKSILVTGAGGSIGAELCRQLLACKPMRLVLYEQSEPALYTTHQELLTLAEETGVEVVAVIGSTCDPYLAARSLARHRVEIVLHAAAHKHVPLVEVNEVEGLRNNVIGTRVMAEAAGAAGVERFVLVSSDKAVRPTNVMGATKRLAELVVQDLANRSTTTLYSMVRFGNVLGSSGSVIPLFQEQILRGGPITLTHADVSRYFMTLSEAARLVLLAGSFAKGGDVFVLDMGPPVKIARLARQMVERAGYTVRDRNNPDGDIEIIITGMRPGEKLHEELLISPGLQITPHPKILRAQEAQLSEIEVANMLKTLKGVVETGNTDTARDLIRRWVKGYQAPRRLGAG